MRKLIIALSLLCSMDAVGMDDQFYYLLGGGEPVTRSATNRGTTIVLGGSVEWNTDLMCGNFDASLSVEEQLKGLKGSFQDIMSNVINSATGAVASLPALILQKTNPALYDLIQNGVLQASEEFHIAKTSCEEIVGVMDDVITNGGWEAAAKGGYWGRKSSAGDEILETKAGADTDGLNEGVIWVEGVRKGGAGQPPIAVVEDTAKAGYNTLLNRNPTNTTSTATSCSGASICDQWDSPQAFSDWMVSVVGERKIRTCAGCDKIETQAGMGLAHQLGLEQEQINLGLRALVDGTTPTTLDELKKVSGGPGMQVSRRVIEALREEREEDQAAIINRLAGEMALARTMERAMIARRAMLAGGNEPNVANMEVAQDEINPYVAELEKEMEHLLFEMEVRSRIAGNTAISLLKRDQLRSQIPIVEHRDPTTIKDGAVPR